MKIRTKSVWVQRYPWWHGIMPGQNLHIKEGGYNMKRASSPAKTNNQLQRLEYNKPQFKLKWGNAQKSLKMEGVWKLVRMTKNNQQPCLLTNRHHSICFVVSVLVIFPMAKNNRSRYKRTSFLQLPKDNQIEDEKQDRKTRN